jgi:hypothetical protein
METTLTRLQGETCSSDAAPAGGAISAVDVTLPSTPTAAEIRSSPIASSSVPEQVSRQVVAHQSEQAVGVIDVDPVPGAR